MDTRTFPAADGVILAGNPKCQTKDASGVTYFQRALDAMQDQGLRSLVVVGNAQDADPHANYVQRPAGTTLAESVSIGLAGCTADYALVIGSDLPHIRPEHVRDFLSRVRECPARPLYCGVAPLGWCRALSPGMRPHFLWKTGLIRFASAYFIHIPSFRERFEPMASDILAHRKNIPKIIGICARNLPRLRPLPGILSVNAALAVDYDPKDCHIP